MPCRTPLIALSMASLMMLAGCSSSRLAAPNPARGGLASAPIVEPVKVEMPEKVEGQIYRAGDVYIAGQPSEEAIRRMASEGVRLVVNVRTPTEMADRERVPFDEVALMNELGIRYVQIPLGRPDHLASPAKVDAFAAELASTDGPVLLHCASAGRASHMWAAYLVRHRGVDPDIAVAHANMIQPNTPTVVDLLGATWEIE